MVHAQMLLQICRSDGNAGIMNEAWPGPENMQIKMMMQVYMADPRVHARRGLRSPGVSCGDPSGHNWPLRRWGARRHHAYAVSRPAHASCVRGNWQGATTGAVRVGGWGRG